jgi:hypothetical protein
MIIVAITNAAHQPPPSHIGFHPPITHHNHKVSIVIKTIAATHFSAETNINCVNGDNGNTDVFRTPTSNFLQNQCKRGQLTRCEAFFQHIPASKQVLRTPHYVLPNPFT